jgi:hypothetical protein
MVLDIWHISLCCLLDEGRRAAVKFINQLDVLHCTYIVYVGHLYLMFAIVPIHQNKGSISLHFRWMFRRWDCILIEVTYAVIPGTEGTVPIVTEKVCACTGTGTQQSYTKWKKVNKFHVFWSGSLLLTEGFYCSLDVFHGGLKNRIFFSIYFYNFLNTLDLHPDLELDLHSEPNRPKMLDPCPDSHCDPKHWKGKFTYKKICNCLFGPWGDKSSDLAHCFFCDTYWMLKHFKTATSFLADKTS